MYSGKKCIHANVGEQHTDKPKRCKERCCPVPKQKDDCQHKGYPKCPIGDDRGGDMESQPVASDLRKAQYTAHQKIHAKKSSDWRKPPAVKGVIQRQCNDKRCDPVTVGLGIIPLIDLTLCDEAGFRRQLSPVSDTYK